MDNDRNSNRPIKNLMTKNFEKPSTGALICGGVMILCAVLYIFIVADTVTKKTNTVTVVQKTEPQTVQKEEINIDEIDATKLEVTDKTITNNANYIIDADYTVEGIDYFKDSFKIPYINFTTGDALNANNEIKSHVREWAKTSAKYKKAFEGTSLDASSLIRSTYEVFTFDNVISVLITFTTREDSLETSKYYAYMFNTSHALAPTTEVNIEGDVQNIPLEGSTSESYLGRKVTLNEVLESMNLNFEEIDAKYKEILTNYSGEYGEQESIASTLENYKNELDSEKLGVFIDKEGRLNIIGKIINSNYKNGTYRIFKFVDGAFISTTMMNE